MKKSNLILLIVTIMLLAFIFSACGELSGASAYDIALKNGFVGTEQEWLDSLKGDRGTDGIDGANGTNGLNGANGLDGANGANGVNGLDGENGINGLNGIDGATVILPDEDINNISYAFSKAILSAVKIVAKHTVNKYLYGQFAGTEEQSFTGAGVIYTLDKNSGDAYIITNYHVLYHKTSLSDNKISNDISVFLYGMDYEQYAISATYIGGSLTYDIAVIKVTASEILKNSISQPVSLSSEEVLPGLKTIAIGNPLSDGLSVTSGIVNVASEYYTNTGADDVTTIDFRAIKIDTPVNGGNSGGGLFNLKGELIGIVNAKQKSVEIDNVGYAIPLEIAIGVAQNLIDNCNESNEKVKKCLLGVQIKILSSTAVIDEETALVHIKEQVAVDNVASENSLVYGILLSGDIFVSAKLNDTTFTIDRLHILADLLLNARIDDTLEFIIIREGISHTESVIITEQSINVIE